MATYLLTAGGLGLVWFRCGLAGCPNVGRLRAYQPGKASRLLDRQRPGLRRAAAGGGRDGARCAGSRRTSATRSWPSRTSASTRTAASTGGAWSGAALANVRGGGVEQGFSTITMQLARNVFPDRIPARERTLGRKLLEVRVAYEIEDRFDKDEILELYLSHIYFGNGARGIDAAARHYFGVPAERLTLRQAALLAGLIRRAQPLRPAPPSRTAPASGATSCSR